MWSIDASEFEKDAILPHSEVRYHSTMSIQTPSDKTTGELLDNGKDEYIYGWVVSGMKFGERETEVILIYPWEIKMSKEIDIGEFTPKNMPEEISEIDLLRSELSSTHKDKQGIIEYLNEVRRENLSLKEQVLRLLSMLESKNKALRDIENGVKEAVQITQYQTINK